MDFMLGITARAILNDSLAGVLVCFVLERNMDADSFGVFPCHICHTSVFRAHECNDAH